MTTGDLRYWFFWFIGLGAVGLGGWIIRRAIFGDRQPYIRRCPGCLHNLTGTPGWTCGECGRTARNEAELHFVIRDWRMVVITLLALGLGLLFVLGKASERGPAGLAPTKVLLWLLPGADPFDSGVYHELAQRMRADELSSREWRWFLHRSIEGDRNHPPGTDAWEAKYGHLIQFGHMNRHWASHGLEAETLAIQPRVRFHTREHWPSDQPASVELTIRDWWPFSAEARLRVIARAVDAAGNVQPEPIAGWRIQRGAEPLTQSALTFTLPLLAPTVKAIELEYHVESEHPTLRPDRRTVTTGRERLTVSQSAHPLTNVMQAVSSEIMDHAVMRAFNGAAMRWGSGPLRFLLRFDPWRTGAPYFEPDTAIGVLVEVLYDGEPVRTSRVWWMAASGSDQAGTELPAFHDPRLDTASLDPDRWQLRITSDPSLALRVRGATHYWEGTLLIPLRVVDAPGSGVAFDWLCEPVDPRELDAAPPLDASGG